MTGLILCGGNSVRMGTDKGLLYSDGISWAEIAYQKLAQVLPVVYLSVNIKQFVAYQAHFQPAALIEDNMQLPVGGPLRGLLSTHLQMPQENLFLLACDLLYMDHSIIKELIQQQELAPGYEAYVFQNHQDAEPLCGIYTAEGLAKIWHACNNGLLNKQSMKHVLEQLRSLYIPLPESKQTFFKNINTREALHG